MSEPNPCLTQMCIEILKNGGTLSDLPKEKTPTLSDVLNLNLGKMKKPIKTIAELAGLNNASMHKILGGEMHPTRNTLLRLALVMELPIETTQVLLKAGNRSLLSGSRPRDLIIMEGLVHKCDIGYVDSELQCAGFNDLFSKQD